MSTASSVQLPGYHFTRLQRTTSPATPIRAMTAQFKDLLKFRRIVVSCLGPDYIYNCFISSSAFNMPSNLKQKASGQKRPPRMPEAWKGEAQNSSLTDGTGVGSWQLGSRFWLVDESMTKAAPAVGWSLGAAVPRVGGPRSEASGDALQSWKFARRFSACCAIIFLRDQAAATSTTTSSSHISLCIGATA